MTVLQFPPGKGRKRKAPPLRDFKITESLSGERVLYFFDAVDPLDQSTITLGVFTTRTEGDQGLANCLAGLAVRT